MWAAGTGTGARYVWYERLPGIWAQGLDTDSLVTALPDMLTLTTATKTQQLFILATRSGGTCRLYRVELAPPSKWQCGPAVPPWMGEALA